MLDEHVCTSLVDCVSVNNCTSVRNLTRFFHCDVTEAETVMNVDVAFSEQALSYRDNHQRLKVTAGPSSPDDKLPVRRGTNTRRVDDHC